MSITVKRLHPHFFAEVSGVDLKKPLTSASFAEIEAAFHEHAVLLFRDQFLTDEQQIAFSEFFGPVQTRTKYHRPDEKHRIGPKLADISNLDHEGKLLPENDARRLHARANQLWHTDGTFKHVPARCSLLAAWEIPGEGGETEFADMRAAYDALPAARKRELDDLVAEHSIFYSRETMGFNDYTDGARQELPPVQQVLVKTHPGSGRKSLYLASHASHIIGWPIEKGRALLQELMEFATRPEFVYQHRWTEGELIIWDNRCTMHRGRPYDEMSVRRVLHRTTVSDEINSVERRRLETGAAA